MEPTKRIIINTIAQYIKVITNTCLALYSTRIVLDALSISDFGLFSVIAGIVGMLGFITNALVVTTQRYMSYYHGEGDIEYVKRIFTNSFFIHLIFGILFCLFLIAIKFILIEQFLTININRIEAAKDVYDITIVIFMITIITSPFKALLIAHENIVYISCVEIIDGILKLILALSLAFINSDKLISYTLGLSFILFLNLFAYIVYGLIKYNECTFNYKHYPIDKRCINQLLGFAGWTTYGMLAGVLRNQGTAAILNHFLGTIVNAAYGIASQVYGAISFFSTSLLNAMNPQIMKAEGRNEHKLMLDLACKESKFSTALMAIISIPVMIEMPAILDFWLKEVPEDTILFCRAILIAFLCDQMTLGLHSANQAMGNIKIYTLLMFTPKILYLPVIAFLLLNGYSVLTVMILYVAIECVVAIMRIPFLRITAGLSIQKYIKDVILPTIPLIVTSLVIGLLCSRLYSSTYSFFFTLIISGIISITVAWFFTLNVSEKSFILNSIQRKRKKNDTI